MRLFTAVCPPSNVLDHLDPALHSVGGSPRWVPRENQHITLAFYADVPEGAVPDLTEELGEVASKHGPFDLRLRGAGSFGGRVLWIGVDGDVAPLRSLAEDCLHASPRELTEEVSPRRPHLTVARARFGQVTKPRGRDRWGKARGTGGETRSELDPAARALAVYAGPGWTVGSFSLIESLPGEGAQGGPLYRPLETWALTG